MTVESSTSNVENDGHQQTSDEERDAVKNDPRHRRTYKISEWRAEGARLFGDDIMQWRFVCPVCGLIATARDWEAAGAPGSAVAFSCVGRWNKAVGCDYAGGGLFRLNPTTVMHDDDDTPHMAFGFDYSQDSMQFEPIDSHCSHVDAMWTTCAPYKEDRLFCPTCNRVVRKRSHLTGLELPVDTVA